MQSFAENPITYSDGQLNVSQPPDATLLSGFIPEQADARGQPLPAGWLNWALRTLFRYANRDKVSDATGVGLFPYPNASITLQAFDAADPNKFLFAIGYKGATGTHALKVVQSATLTLGTATPSGDQPILGGTTVKTVGYNRLSGDL